jgi:hypothetical protein
LYVFPFPYGKKSKAFLLILKYVIKHFTEV